MSKVLSEISDIRVIQIAAQLDRELAFSYGLESSIGDCVILYNPTIDPIHLIEESIEKYNEGYDIIQGIEVNQRQSIGYKVIRPILSGLLRKLGYIRNEYETDFYCLSRVAANSLFIRLRKKYNLYFRISQSYLSKSYIKYEKVNQREILKKALESQSLMF